MADDIIFFDKFCGKENIYDAFWSYEFTVNTSTPDFTNCFRDTVLLAVPTLYLLIGTPFYVCVFNDFAPEGNYGNITKLGLVKLLTKLFLVALAIGDLLYIVIENGIDGGINYYPVDYLAAFVKVVIYTIALLMQIWCTRRGIYSSGLLFVFWFLILLVYIVQFRSFILQYDYTGASYLFITFYIHFTLVLLQVICSCIPDHADNIIPWTRLKPETRPLLSETGPFEKKLPVIAEEGKPCPKIGATFLSKLFFHWFTPTIIQGYRRALLWEDIWQIRKEDSAYDIVPKFEQEWQKELDKYPGPIDVDDKKSKKPSLGWAIARTFGAYYSVAGILVFLFFVAMLINPQLLQLIIGYVESDGGYTWQGVIYAIAMFLASVCSVLFIHHGFNLSYTVGMRIRTALSTAIYRKALRLSPSARKFKTVGEIVNLMSVDTQKLQDIPQFLHFVWVAPIVIALVIYFLYQIIGPSCFVGLAYMLILLPVNSIVMAKLIRKYQKKQMSIKDERIKLMNQVLSGIKVLKLYAWEDHFQAKLMKLREEELKCIKRIQLLSAITYNAFYSSPYIVAVLDFATYVLSDPTNILDASTAFVSISLINLLNFPMGILPMALMYAVMGLVSVKRIRDFLLTEEIDRNNVQNNPHVEAAIEIHDGTFSWGEEERVTLQDINMTALPGRMIAVVGQVGSGKSSILSAILGEMKKHQGRVNVLGSIAYVPQQAWIQNLTLQDNILFSKVMHEARYHEVLKACELEQDLEILPGGDMTEIGERGINLSGGQKQRVSLARAVYQDADIYLLDDTLSAVDAHVGKHIYNNIIGSNGLLKDKTRIFVTNQLQYLRHADGIIVLKDGKISEQGSYVSLIQNDGAFAELIRTYEISSEDEEVIEEIRKLKQQVSQHNEATTPGGDLVLSGSDKRSHTSKSRKRKATHKSEDGLSIKPASEKLKPKEKKNIIIEESVEEGSVKLSVVKYYLEAAGAMFFLLVFLSFIIFIASQVTMNIWLSLWSSDQPVNGTYDRELLNLRLGVYGGLGISQSLAVLGLAMFIAFGSISASRTLHRELLDNILKCPMSFFDTTPLGRIVNRFSKDIDIVDANIPTFTQSFITSLAPLISTFIVITYSFPYFVVVFVPLLIFFCIMQRVYVACARQLKRLDSIKRSPLYAFFQETLNGVSSVRAFGQQKRFIAQSDKLLDNNQRVWFEVFTSNRWIGIYAELVGDIVVLSTALFAVFTKGQIDPGLVGLSLTYALGTAGGMVMTMRASCELETYIVAVERIKEYTEAEIEAEYHIAEKKPTRSWPQQGEVEFRNYKTKYRPELELVLKGVSCKINPGEKVGIVGRTGAGKSSMTLSLFRLIEATNGSIVIDGIDIKELGLHDVRGRLTIIPQDPVIFSGTLRFNLDPADNYSDNEIWEALEHAHLKSFVKEKLAPQEIEYECGEEGENLSVGQRQLLCLARALLRKSKILVLDEATASVDMETDDLIQQTIRSEFKDSTVITIAHRLNTIMDYDRVIVMDSGKLKEYDSPTKLLENKSSAFYSMAADAGLV